MTTPMTHANLPPHQPLDLTQEQREQMPIVNWHNYTAPSYKHLKSTNTHGVWTIGHPMENSGGFEPVSISYQLPLGEGETYASVMDEKKDLDFSCHEAWALWAKISPQEIGYAVDQDHAALFIEKALRQPSGVDPEKVLIDGGFIFQHEIESRLEGGPPTRVFRKKVGSNRFFSVMMSPGSLWLMHEKSPSTSWDNLLRVSTFEEGNNTQIIPRFLSPHVANIVAAAADMSVYLSETWAPTSKVRRRPKP